MAGLVIEAVSQNRVGIRANFEVERETDNRFVFEAGQLNRRRLWIGHDAVRCLQRRALCPRDRYASDAVRRAFAAPVARSDRVRVILEDGWIAGVASACCGCQCRFCDSDRYPLDGSVHARAPRAGGSLQSEMAWRKSLAHTDRF